MSVSFRDTIVLGGSDSPDVGNLDYCHILYQNIITEDSVLASTAEADFPGESVVSPFTRDQWRPTELDATLTFTFDSAVDANAFGIAGHTMFQTGTSAVIEYTTDLIAWTELATVAPQSNSPIMAISPNTITAIAWRVRFVGGSIADTPLAVGVVFIGKAMVMQRRIYGGHTPSRFARQTQYIASETDTGQSLGLSTVRQGTDSSFNFDNLTAQWMRSKFYPFYDHSDAGGYAFVSWYPNKFSSEVVYGHPRDFSVSNKGQRDLMSASFSVRGVLLS